MAQFDVGSPKPSWNKEMQVTYLFKPNYSLLAAYVSNHKKLSTLKLELSNSQNKFSIHKMHKSAKD